MESALIDFWTAFCETNNLEPMSADELLIVHHMSAEVNLTAEQEQIVRKFIDLWELVV